MYRKTVLEISITFFIAVIIYILVDFNFVFVSEWSNDKIVNFLHTWFTLASAYYLYNFLLKLGFKKWPLDKLQHWVVLLFGISALVLFYVVITELVFYKLYYQIESLFNETTFYEFDLPFTLVLLILGSLFFYQKYYFKSILETPKKGMSTSKKIKANKGKGHVFISPESVGLIYIDNNVVWLQTIIGETYHTDYSLSYLLTELDATQFFRLNRQSIVSKKAVLGIERLAFQKLKVELIDSINYDFLVVSKYNAPSFKKWLTNSDK